MPIALVLAASLLACAATAAAAPPKSDRGFSKDGRVTTGFGATDSAIADLAETEDRGVIAVGGARHGFRDCRFAVARYDREGRLDRSFAGDGETLLNFGTSQLECADARHVAVDGEGRAVIGGVYSGPGLTRGLAIARLLPDGTLDPSFDGDGVLTIPEVGCCGGLALQPDGKIVVGLSQYAANRFLVGRFDSDGSLDKTFGGDGLAEGPALGEWSSGVDLALRDDGRIVVAGVSADGSDCSVDEDELCSPMFAVAQFQPDGQVDAGFGKGGGATTGAGFDRPGQDYAIADSLAIQRNGRIVVGGDTWVHGCGFDGCDGTNPDIDFAVARFTESGKLDRSFGKRGTALTDVERGRVGLADTGTGGVVATRSGVVQAGYAGTPEVRFTLVGLKDDGRSDRRFGKKGVGRFRPAGFAQASVAAAKNRLYVGGSVERKGYPDRRDEAFALARYRLP